MLKSSLAAGAMMTDGLGIVRAEAPAPNYVHTRGVSRRNRRFYDDEPRGFAGAKLIRKARRGQLGIARIR